MDNNTLNIGTNFSDIHPNAKAWVYTSSIAFSEKNIEQITQLAKVFLSQWNSHGKKVKGTIQIINSQFIAIFADVGNDIMCGRAQDASVRFIKELEEVLETTLLDRTLVGYKSLNRIKVENFNILKQKVKDNQIKETTLFYNGLIQTKQDFLSNWETPIKESWLI